MKGKTSKKDTPCKIYKVGGWLDSKGFSKIIREIDATEKENTFVYGGWN